MVERLIVETGGETVAYGPEGEAESRAAAREVAEAAVPSGAASAAGDLAPIRPRPWPQFRGPRGSGIADEQGVPLRWNAADGEGIAWEAALPGLGVSSPIVWEDRVYVVIAASLTEDSEFRIGLYGDVAPVQNDSAHRFELRAYDLANGAPVWTTELRRGVPKTRRHTKSSQANATPVTDGERIVTLLGSMGVLLCHDLEGNLLWEREVGVLNSGWFYDPDYQWGHASSPVIHGGAVIVLADVHGDAFLGAFNLEDGEPLWRTSRDEVSTFSTPFVHDVGGDAEVVVNGTVIRGYDASTGAERWRLGPNSEIPISVPLLGDGLLFVQAGYPPIRPIYAIRPGMEGDLSLAPGEDSSEAIAWSKSRGGVYIPSPIFYRGVLYLGANNGRLSAYDGETGERLYRARIGGHRRLLRGFAVRRRRPALLHHRGRGHLRRAGGTRIRAAREEQRGPDRDGLPGGERRHARHPGDRPALRDHALVPLRRRALLQWTAPPEVLPWSDSRFALSCRF